MNRAVTDYIIGMSDEFATRPFEELFVPQKRHRFVIAAAVGAGYTPPLHRLADAALWKRVRSQACPAPTI